jgi:hypothetical protein
MGNIIRKNAEDHQQENKGMDVKREDQVFKIKVLPP